MTSRVVGEGWDPTRNAAVDDDGDGYADVRRGIACPRAEWDLMDPYLREHYRWLIRSAPRCSTHLEAKPCLTCQSYIAAGL